MTLDEAIKHAEEVAEEKLNNAVYIMDKMKSDVALKNAEKCKQCAEEHSQLAEWLKELKQLREQTRWIPVSERLPKSDEDVLACYLQGRMEVVYYHIDDTYYPTQYEDLNETGWFNENDDPTDEPIAWMPLPETYNAESEEVYAESNNGCS